MNPSSEAGPTLNLPLPDSSSGQFRSPETRGVSPDLSPTHQIEGTGRIMPAPQAVHAAAPAQQADPAASTSATADDSAQSDVKSNDIDQEWIFKAKSVVESTKGDPYSQSNALEKVKAEYLRVRYDKHLRVKQNTT